MKKYLNYLFFICVGVVFTSTTLVAQKKAVVKKKTPTVVKPIATATPKPVEEVTFENGIKIKCIGLKIKSAALYFDDQSKVPQDNMIDVNQRVNMLVTLDSGWAVVDGKVYPGGSQVIRLSTGATILKSDDLFAAYSETGVDPEDAKYITLKAAIKSIEDKKNFINVNFRIWDKKSSGEIIGSYTFFIK